jgi:hypothetical protein
MTGTTTALANFTANVIEKRPLIPPDQTNQNNNNQNHQLLSPHRRDVFETNSFLRLCLSLFYLFSSRTILFYVFYVVFGVLGLAVSQLFFCVHLLDIALRSSLLRSVIKSVTFHGRQILMTSLFALVVTYMFAIFGFKFFRNYYLSNDSFDCESLAACIPITLVKNKWNSFF